MSQSDPAGLSPRASLNDPTAQDDVLSRLRDRLDIVETLNRFTLAVDARDAAAMRGCLADRVRFDYRALGADMPEDADTFCAQIVADQRRSFHATQHALCNQVVALSGSDRAVCVTNYRATHWLPDDPDGELWELAGHYHYDLVRLDERWRITGCTIHVAWTQGNARYVGNVRKHNPL